MDIQQTKDKIDIYQTLKDRFGFDAFRSGQEEVITTLLGACPRIGILVKIEKFSQNKHSHIVDIASIVF